MANNIKGTGRRFTDDEVTSLMVQPYLAGRGLLEIARATGTSVPNVRYHLLRRGVTMRRVGFSPNRAAAANRVRRRIRFQAVEMYLEGLTIGDIAARLDAPATAVTDVLRQQGVALRHARRRFNDATALEIRRQYEAGENTVTLGQRYDADNQVIRKTILRAGGTLRRPQESVRLRRAMSSDAR